MRAGGGLMTRLMKRLRRRGRRYPTWRIVFYDGVGGCEVVEVVRKYRPTRNARVRQGERRPVGGGLISRPSVPLLSCFPLAILSQAGGGGGWLWGRVGERGSAVGLGRAGGEGAPPDAA